MFNIRHALALVVVSILFLFAMPRAAFAAGAPLSRTGWVASASSTNGSDVASQALDGNPATRWSTGTQQVNGQWFQVDMLSPQTFAQITLEATGRSNAYPRQYQVFVSNDAVNWGSPIATGTGSVPFIT